MVKIALAQYPISYHVSLDSWKEHLSNWMQQTEEADIVVFPEYGSMELVSLFQKEVQQDIRAQLIELQSILEDFKRTFREFARKTGKIIIAPSFPVAEEGSVFNRVFVFSADSEGYQDKWHMTRFENEEWGVHSSKKKLSLFVSGNLRFGIQICYDIEFPAGSRILAQAGANLIIAPSCTETLRGATRVHIGARARAMENQLFTVVSQTILDAPWSPAVDVNYGYAAAYSSPDKNLPETGILFEGKHQQSGFELTELDCSLNDSIRSDGQVLNYRDFGFHEIHSEDVEVTHVYL